MKKIYTLITLLAAFLFGQAQSGTLDPTFGDGGVVTTSISAVYNISNAIAVQSDGKIIACGEAGPSSNKDIAVVRYNEDGSLDNTFGTNGITVIAVSIFSDFGLSVAIQTDGKIVVGGYLYNGSSTDVILIRLNDGGTRDNTFGTNGVVVTDFGGGNEVAEAIAIQADGKILLGGDHNDKFMVLRYKTNGTLDNTFGTLGRTSANVGTGPCYAKSIAVQEDGKIVAGGMGFNGYNNFGFAMARFNTNGTLDNTFADAGTKLFNVVTGNDFITKVAIQEDGKIVAGGHTWVGNQPLRYDFAAMRLNADGSMDNTFGSEGIKTVNIIFGANYVTGLAVQTDGKILLGGYTGIANDFNLAVVRLDSHGRLDPDFGEEGITTTDVAGNPDYSNALAIQPDGKIVTSGYTYNTDETSQFLIVRYDNLIVGTSEPKIAEFSIYPNPATEYLTVDLQGIATQYQIDIMDISGKRVYSDVLTKSGKINVSAFTSGTYFIRLKSAKDTVVSRFIKK